MRRLWIVLGIAVLIGALAIGAIACSSDDDDDDGGATPEATEQMEPTEMQATEPAGGEPTEVTGGDFSTVVVMDGILTTFDGYTLYTFDSDEAGVSNCFEACADTWPALQAGGEPTAGDGVSGTLGTIERQDGVTQVTYNDQPLYLYSGDASPGDRNGDGFGDVWHVVAVA